MKTNVRRMVYTLMCMMLCVSLYAQKGSIVGDWSYSAPSAPYGYDNGTMSIKQADGKLTGEVNIQGSIIKINEIKQEGETYTCTVYVDGYPLDVKLKQNGEMLEGTADDGQTPMALTLKRKK